MKKMEFVKELYDDDLRGVAATIVKAVKDRTIDLDYVFSQQFEHDLWEYDEHWFDTLMDDWKHSLIYFEWKKDEVEELIESRKDEFEDDFEMDEAYEEELRYELGFVTYKSKEYTSMDLAKFVIFHLRTHLFADAASYLDEVQLERKSIEPSIMDKQKELYTGAGPFHLYNSDTKEDLQLTVTTGKWISTSRHGLNTFGSTYHSIDEPTLVYISPYWYSQPYLRGFLAALLGLLFTDAHRRELLSIGFDDRDDVDELEKCFVNRRVNTRRLPKVFGVPAKHIIEAYLPKAMEAMKAQLMLEDMAFDDTDEYTMRKMAELEQGEAKRIVELPLWQLFEPAFRQTLMAYHTFFVNYLLRQIGEEQLPVIQPTTPEQTHSDKPDCSFFAIRDNMTYERCERELMNVLTNAKNKTTVCKEIRRSSLSGYFNLLDKTDQEKADLLNPWLKAVGRDFVLTRDDFLNARRYSKK